MASIGGILWMTQRMSEINIVSKNNLSRERFHFVVMTISIKATLESLFLVQNESYIKTLKLTASFCC